MKISYLKMTKMQMTMKIVLKRKRLHMEKLTMIQKKMKLNMLRKVNIVQLPFF